MAIVNRYWKCQVLGWSLLGLVAVLIPTLFGGLRWAVVGRALTGSSSASSSPMDFGAICGGGDGCGCRLGSSLRDS